MSKPNNPRNITLDMSYGGQGDLLVEVVRAYLHTANPSAFIHRVMEGVIKYRQEVEAKSTPVDRIIAANLEQRLRLTYDDLRTREDTLYDTTTSND